MHLLISTLIVINFASYIYLPIAVTNDVPCSTLMDYVTSIGIFPDKVTPKYEASFVVEVERYKIDGVYYAVAKLIIDKEGRTKKYIYCNIPESDWTDFEWELVDRELSFNAKFRKYIHIHKCDCE